MQQVHLGVGKTLLYSIDLHALLSLHVLEEVTAEHEVHLDTGSCKACLINCGY